MPGSESIFEVIQSVWLSGRKKQLVMYPNLILNLFFDLLLEAKKALIPDVFLSCMQELRRACDA